MYASTPSVSLAQLLVFTKPYVLMNAKSMSPAQWWQQYGKHIPLIASVAKRVLAQVTNIDNTSTPQG